MDLFNYQRHATSTVHVGQLTLGGNAPVRVQSMTNTPTADTEACVRQAERIVAAGGEIVRLTTQGLREARNMGAIRALLRERGCMAPLVADVHFNAAVADEAATQCEAVRINPGNYVDPARTFRRLEYTDEEYRAELEKIDRRFVPLLRICKAHHTALRIGVNHGSLSDRIMSRYGDTPAGMVESCMEFLRICVREQFPDVVISIKASNTVVMVRTVRLLVARMEEEHIYYPLHLGVTEAGEGEDGRIKSAVGIGALLSDGLGDTIRVSLSEAPEAEIPVAVALRDYIMARAGHAPIEGAAAPDFNYLDPQRRATDCVGELGGGLPPVVYDTESLAAAEAAAPGRFVTLVARHQNPVGQLRADIHRLWAAGDRRPVVLRFDYNEPDRERFQLRAAADLGALCIDRLFDGLCLTNPALPASVVSDTAYAILQAARLRMTRPEFISCPGCGRTLYNLEDTISRIKQAVLSRAAADPRFRTLKVGIMGCIVNGPGEMADADYGYVGAGVGRVSLYKQKQCVEKNIPEAEAVERLMAFIEQDLS